MRRIYFALLVSLLGLTACDSVLDTNPRASVAAETAVQTEKDAESAILGVYSILQYDDLYGQYAVVIPDLYSDDLDHTGTFTSLGEFDNNNVFPDNVSINDGWSVRYVGINRANSVLMALDRLEEISDDKRTSLKGEALFLRAFLHFELARYFGGVPIVTEPTDGADEISRPARNTLEEVYARVEADLKEAETLLPASKSAGRASKLTAKALLARLYLYQERWADAFAAADEVIESDAYSLVGDYATLMETKNSPESILEVQFSTNDANSLAFWFFPDELGGRLEYAPSVALYEAYEEGDQRRHATVGNLDGLLYGTKYFRISNGDDNVFVLRLAEMYLIRAEALARQGGAVEAVQADINAIRNRAGLGDTEADTVEELLDAILQERRVEFALEGHRFFDLRRTGRAMEVLGITNPDRLLFPIPQAELDVNPNLVQNPGY